MLARQRRSAILEIVRRTGEVTTSQLVRHLGVSEMTIRRDLDALADLGLLAKVRGGATVAGVHPADEPGFAAKSVRQRAEKAAIAAYAAALVQPGSAIALSGGTTTAGLARHLVDVPGLTVVTNSLPVADLLYRAGRTRATEQTIVLTGGVRTPSLALAGLVAEAVVARLNVDVLFLGVHGMSPRTGFTTPNLAECGINRLLVAAAHRLVVLADHTKWETVGIATVAALEDADVLITDEGISDAAYVALADRVGELVVVPAPGGAAIDTAGPHRHC